MHLMYPCIVCVFPNANQTVLQMLLISPSPEKGAIQDAGKRVLQRRPQVSTVPSYSWVLNTPHTILFLFFVCFLFLILQHLLQFHLFKVTNQLHLITLSLYFQSLHHSITMYSGLKRVFKTHTANQSALTSVLIFLTTP